MKLILFVITSLSILASPVAAQEQDPIASRLDEAIDAAAAHDRFYGAVLLARDGEVVLRRAVGVVDEEGTPATPGQPYNVGSIGKLFTQARVLQLVKEGALALDDTVAMRLPNSGLPGAEEITIRQLLSHQSGYGNYFDHPDYTLEQRELNDFLALVRSDEVKAPPGEGFAYSNSAFWVLAAILEEVDAEERDWQSILEEEVFDRAEMDVREFQPDSEYADRPQGFVLQPDGSIDTAFDDPRPGPDGGWYATVDDLLAFDTALQEGIWFGPELRAESMIPHSHFPTLGADVGLVWEIYDEGEITYVTKGGTTVGGGAELVRFSIDDEDCTFIMLSNLENAPVKIFREVLAYALGLEGAQLPGPPPMVAFYNAAVAQSLPQPATLDQWAAQREISVSAMPMLLAANALRKEERFNDARALLILTLSAYPDDPIAQRLLASISDEEV